MAENLRNTLIRVWSKDLRVNYGNVVVAEVLRRTVEGPGLYGTTVPYVNGAVLIDAEAAIGPVARGVTKAAVIVTIRDTTEFMWSPVGAHLMAGDYWTVEMVPYVELSRVSQISDAEVIRRAHQ